MSGPCRFGGDEFFVMFVGTSEREVRHIADRVSERIRRANIRVQDDRRTQVSICTGIKFVESDHTVTAEEVLLEADKALYDSKMSRKPRADDVNAVVA